MSETGLGSQANRNGNEWREFSMDVGRGIAVAFLAGKVPPIPMGVHAANAEWRSRRESVDAAMDQVRFGGFEQTFYARKAFWEACNVRLAGTPGLGSD